MKKEVVTRFMQLFDGATSWAGLWTPPKKGSDDKKGSVVSVPRFPNQKEWEGHLSGKGLGVGICPIRQDGTSLWGCLDFDYDNINRKELAEKVKRLNLPLYICSTRSNRAHAYIFCAEPGRRAIYINEVLKIYAGLLGYPNDPKVEVWPEKGKLNKDGKAQWINLPYFGNTRKLENAEGETLTLEQFLDHVQPLSSKQAFPVPLLTPDETQNAPPCLVSLLEEGIPKGERNRGLFNYAVLFNKSDPDHLRERLIQVNDELCNPSYPIDEMTQTLKSVMRKGYEYQCSHSPIQELCNREVCIGRPYGIGNSNKSSEEGVPTNGHFLAFKPTRLKKLNSDPPIYYLQFNESVWVQLKGEVFWNHKRVWEACNNKMHCVFDRAFYGPKGSEKWLTMVSELHQTIEIIEAPEESSTQGQVNQYLWLYLQKKKPGNVEETLKRGKIVVQGDYVYFRLLEFNEFMSLNRFVHVASHEIWSYLSAAGCQYEELDLKGKETSLAKIHIEKVQEPKEDLSPVSYPQKEEFE